MVTNANGGRSAESIRPKRRGIYGRQREAGRANRCYIPTCLEERMHDVKRRSSSFNAGRIEQHYRTSAIGRQTMTPLVNACRERALKELRFRLFLTFVLTRRLVVWPDPRRA